MIFSRAVWKREGGAGTAGPVVSARTSAAIQGEKKLLDHVGIFISNSMRGSILDTNYAAMQSDLSKLQGEEEKRKIPLTEQGLPSPGKPLEPAGAQLNHVPFKINF